MFNSIYQTYMQILREQRAQISSVVSTSTTSKRVAVAQNPKFKKTVLKTIV